MKSKIAILIVLVTQISNIYCQKKRENTNKTDGFEVQINTKNLQGKKLELCLHYGLYREKTIADSTTIKTNDQKVFFSKKQKVLGAIYFLRFAKENNGINLALDNAEKLQIQLHIADINSLEIVQNSKNEDFLNFQKSSTTASEEENKKTRNALIAKYPASVLALYLKMQNKIATKLDGNSFDLDSFQKNYFNDAKPSDPRMFLIPNVYQWMFKYVSSFPVNNQNYQNSILKFLSNLQCSSNNYTIYAKWFLSNFLYYEAYNLEASYRYFFDNYVDVKGCATFTDAEIAGYRNKYETIKTIPMHTKVPNLLLEDTNQTEFNLYSTYPNFDYTFIAFFSPTCSHCNQTMPKVQEYFQRFQVNNPQLKLQLISVLNDSDSSQWQQFITDKKIENWKNLKSKNDSREFQKDFNAYANPNFVLCDKTGIILLKTYNPKALNEIFTRQNK